MVGKYLTPKTVDVVSFNCPDSIAAQLKSFPICLQSCLNVGMKAWHAPHHSAQTSRIPGVLFFNDEFFIKILLSLTEMSRESRFVSCDIVLSIRNKKRFCEC